jgi:hypothetical protein
MPTDDYPLLLVPRGRRVEKDIMMKDGRMQGKGESRE